MIQRSTVALIAAAVTAVLTVSGAVSVVFDRANAGPAVTAIPGTNSDAPGVAWTLDPAKVLGHQFAVFRSPLASSEFDDGSGGFIDGGDILVTKVGLPNQSTGRLDRPTMVGIDAKDGSVLWQAPTGNLSGCAATPVEKKGVCYNASFEGAPSIATIDLENGEVTRYPTDWTILALAVSNDTLFTVEGNAEDNDIRVHSGRPDDLDANWTQSFDLGDSWENIYGQIVKVQDGVGVLQLGGEAVGFDLATGARTWSRSIPDCSESMRFTLGAIAMRTMTDCAQGAVVGSEAIDSGGKVLASSKQEAAQRLAIDRPSDMSIPILVGDSAYDRRTGEKRWTSSDLVSTPDTPRPEVSFLNATVGTAVAVVGNVAWLVDIVGQSQSALDLRIGKRLWRKTGDVSGPPDAYDGSSVIWAQGDKIVAKDPRTGDVRWEIPFDAIVDKGTSTFSDQGTIAESKDGLIYATEHAVVSLRACC